MTKMKTMLPSESWDYNGVLSAGAQLSRMKILSVSPHISGH